MRVFIASFNPYTLINPFISTLVNGINYQFSDIQWGWGIEKFWSEDIFSYSIVHFHWPEHLFVCKKKFSFKDLQERLAQLKTRNIKIISHCHNLEPHNSKVGDGKLYHIIYSNSDAIIHLAYSSMEELKRTYPNTNHIVIPHHIYDNLYPKLPSKQKCQAKLNLNPQNKYILCFGAFRHTEEKQLVYNVGRSFTKTRVYIIAPLILSTKVLPKSVFFIIKRILYFFFHIIIFDQMKDISDSDLPLYFRAADICLIQRLKILNSGNVPMAMFMGNIVIGPDIGNVGYLLKQTSNATFNINSTSNLHEIIQKELLNKNLGRKNEQYAKENWNTKKICQILHSFYNSIIQV